MNHTLGRVICSGEVDVARNRSGKWRTKMARPNYRRRRGFDTWHFCTNCSNWPTSDYETSTRPTTGELCNECRGKENGGNCR